MTKTHTVLSRPDAGRTGVRADAPRPPNQSPAPDYRGLARDLAPLTAVLVAAAYVTFVVPTDLAVVLLALPVAVGLVVLAGFAGVTLVGRYYDGSLRPADVDARHAASALLLVVAVAAWLLHPALAGFSAGVATAILVAGR
ncbi:hypothetical protein ACFQH6_08080 [Halobacteriaceae archaeon GCM10025711]